MEEEEIKPKKVRHKINLRVYVTQDFAERLKKENFEEVDTIEDEEGNILIGFNLTPKLREKLKELEELKEVV